MLTEQYEDAPYSDWPQHEAEEISFSKWATVEITQEVRHLTMDDSIGILFEKFALKMEVFAATSMTDVQSGIFKFAAGTWSLLEIQEIQQYIDTTGRNNIVEQTDCQKRMAIIAELKLQAQPGTDRHWDCRQ